MLKSSLIILALLVFGSSCGPLGSSGSKTPEGGGSSTTSPDPGKPIVPPEEQIDEKRIECDASVNCLAATITRFLSGSDESEAKTIITAAIGNIGSKTLGNGIDKFYKGGRTVFSLTSLPHLIFKKVADQVTAQKEVSKSARAACEISRCQLSRLVVPKSQSLKVDIAGTDHFFLVEEKLDLKAPGELIKQQDEWEKLLMAMKDDVELKKKIKRLSLELAIFVANTGLWDLKSDNLILLADQKKSPQFGLVDLESISTKDNPDALKALFTGARYDPILPHDFYDDAYALIMSEQMTFNDELWPKSKTELPELKAKRKSLSEHFAFIQKKGFTLERLEREGIRKASPFLKCQIDDARLNAAERKVAQHVDTLLSWSVNASWDISHLLNIYSLMGIRSIKLNFGGNFPAFLSPPILWDPPEQEQFENDNTSFIRDELGINPPIDEKASSGWGTQYCNALKPTLDKAVQLGSIFGYRCEIEQESTGPAFTFSIKC